MTAPATTTRETPVGVDLKDGFSTVIAFAADPDVSLWEKGVTPPGADGGEPIDTSTMHNTTWRTMASRALKTLTGGEMTAAYDPTVFTQLVSLINVEDAITVHFPNGDTLDFYGFLQSFEPDENVEGEHPQATVVFTPTNTDPSTGEEEGPVLTPATGT